MNAKAKLIRVALGNLRPPAPCLPDWIGMGSLARAEAPSPG